MIQDSKPYGYHHAKFGCGILVLQMNDIVTVEEAARFLHKHPDTIRRWIETKKLKARHLSAGGHGIYVILRNDLLELFISGSLETREKSTHLQVPSAQRSLPI